jgi:hypothetical protein
VGDDGGDDGKLNKPLLVVVAVVLLLDGASPSPKTSLGGQMKNPLAGGFDNDPCALDPDADVVGRPVFHNCGIFPPFRFFFSFPKENSNFFFDYATKPLNDLNLPLLFLLKC